MKKNNNIPKLYKRFYVDKCDERRELFQAVSTHYSLEKGIYAGSFVHITPSFYIQDMTYVDFDKRMNKFFKDEQVYEYIKANKTYEGKPLITYYQKDYSDKIPVKEKSYDVIFSFFSAAKGSGFISQACKKYLKQGGLLVCNNSHGDASIAATDPMYQLIAVINRNNTKFYIQEKRMDDYLKKKNGKPIDQAKVKETIIGETFSKKAYAYIFKLIEDSDIGNGEKDAS